jgi:hypothetical protein
VENDGYDPSISACKAEGFPISLIPHAPVQLEPTKGRITYGRSVQTGTQTEVILGDQLGVTFFPGFTAVISYLLFPEKEESTTGFEPVSYGFADRYLTARSHGLGVGIQGFEPRTSCV